MNLFERIFGSENLERQRYDYKAENLLLFSKNKKVIPYKFKDTVREVPEYLREPYEIYLETIKRNIKENHKVLEVACGTGKFSEVLLKKSKEVYFLDISKTSLKVIKKRFVNFENFKCVQGRMEALPFENKSFDMIVTSGSLSYSNIYKFLEEIKRVLKHDGIFICVDTLNSNPFHLVYRLINIFFVKRSLLTFFRIPRISTLKLFYKFFSQIKIRYFGKITFLMPLLSCFMRQKKCKKLSSLIDQKIRLNFLAFKFVLSCRGRGE